MHAPRPRRRGTLAQRIDDVLPRLPADLADHTSAETHGRRSSSPPSRTRPSADADRAARRPARRAGERARRAAAWPRPSPARTRRRSGRTRASRPARATSSSTGPCASWPGASRPSPCTSTSASTTRERAIGVVNRLRAHLPLLLALSANSPFWQGRDTRPGLGADAALPASSRASASLAASRPTRTGARRSTCSSAAARSPSRPSCGGTCARSRATGPSRSGSWTRRRP